MKYAIVTGGTRGLGKEFTLKLLSEGYYVIATYLGNDLQAKKTLDEVEKSYLNFLSLIKHDLSNLNKVDLFVSKIQEITTRVDLIVFNAGATDRTSLEEQTVENWDKVFNTNLNVPLFIIQKLLPNFREKSSIIFIGSTMGVFPHSSSLAYGVSKSAVNALVSNLVKFLIKYDIRVNAIIPGFIETEWHNSKSIELIKRIESKISLGYFCPPSKIADFLIAIISNDYINGQCLQIDGGYNFQ